MFLIDEGGAMTRIPATIFTLLISAVLAAPQGSAQAAEQAAAAQPQACPAILNKTFNRLQDDAPQDLCQYAGKVILVVNTASYCGYTPQYKGLEELHAKYAARGLVILGFPSNDFGKQEPGSSKEIAELCYNTYGVKFPMFAKSPVKGAAANPLHQELTKATGQEPKWNFTKYLIDRNGKVLAHFPSKVEPGNKELVAKIEQALSL
jgi:glutathione peroxidase